MLLAHNVFGGSALQLNGAADTENEKVSKCHILLNCQSLYISHSDVVTVIYFMCFIYFILFLFSTSFSVGSSES